MTWLSKVTIVGGADAGLRGLGVRGLEVNRRCSGGESNERSTGYLGLGSGLGVPADSTWTDGMRVTARGWGARNLKGVGLPIADSSESESDVGDGFPSDSRAALPKIRGLWGATIVNFSFFLRSWFDGLLM